MKIFAFTASDILGDLDAVINYLEDYPRVIIVGGPNTGKSTVADKAGAKFDRPVRHTDSLVKLGWSEASAEASTWFDIEGPWIIEGVAVPRALRKWIAAHPLQNLDAHVLMLEEPLTPLTKGQASMAKGVATVWNEIFPVLRTVLL